MTDPDDDSLLDELFGDAPGAPGTSNAPDATEKFDEAARPYIPPAPRESEERLRGRSGRRGGVGHRALTWRRRTPSDGAAPGTELRETGLPGLSESGLSESGLSGTELPGPAVSRRGLPGGGPAGSGDGPEAPEWSGPAWTRHGVRPSAAPGCREIGLTTTGFVIFVSVDSIMMYAPFRAHGSASLLPQAITLLFLAFGLGALLVWNIRGAFRPVGVGMMLGWVFMTLISAGYLTGLNP